VPVVPDDCARSSRTCWNSGETLTPVVSIFIAGMELNCSRSYFLICSGWSSQLRYSNAASGFLAFFATNIPPPRPAGCAICVPLIAGNGMKPGVNFALFVISDTSHVPVGSIAALPA
jgi:hypothetical protein